jgi:hypothetical protein
MNLMEGLSDKLVEEITNIDMEYEQQKKIVD